MLQLYQPLPLFFFINNSVNTVFIHCRPQVGLYLVLFFDVLHYGSHVRTILRTEIFITVLKIVAKFWTSLYLEVGDPR